MMIHHDKDDKDFNDKGAGPKAVIRSPDKNNPHNYQEQDNIST